MLAMLRLACEIYWVYPMKWDFALISDGEANRNCFGSVEKHKYSSLGKVLHISLLLMLRFWPCVVPSRLRLVFWQHVIWTKLWKLWSNWCFYLANPHIAWRKSNLTIFDIQSNIGYLKKGINQNAKLVYDFLNFGSYIKFWMFRNFYSSLIVIASNFDKLLELHSFHLSSVHLRRFIDAIMEILFEIEWWQCKMVLWHH